MEEFAGFLSARGVPFPLFSAFLSAHAQFICGALFIAGLATRYAAVVMINKLRRRAYNRAHWGHLPQHVSCVNDAGCGMFFLLAWRWKAFRRQYSEEASRRYIDGAKSGRALV